MVQVEGTFINRNKPVSGLWRHLQLKRPDACSATPNMLHLDDFLRRGGTDLASITAHLNSLVGLEPGDELLAVGSLVEGFGSSKSDLDLILITDRDNNALRSEDHVASVVGNCLIDVLVLPFTDIDVLLSRFQAWAGASWNVTKSAGFTLAERTLLHRLLNGRSLVQSIHRDRLSIRKPNAEQLSRLKLQASRQNARTIQVDLIGYRDERDYRSLSFAAQEVLGEAGDALLAGYRLTNPLRKWRSRLLASLPSDWEASLGLNPSGLTANDMIWRLHRAPEEPLEDECLTHALRITTFARRVFAWAEFRLLRGVDFQGQSVCRGQGDWVGGRPLPFLDLDVDFFLADQEIMLGRLNDFNSNCIIVTPNEFNVVLLFDGVTTPHEAERAVYGSENNAGHGVAESLTSRSMVADLMAKAPQQQGAS